MLNKINYSDNLQFHQIKKKLYDCLIIILSTNLKSTDNLKTLEIKISSFVDKILNDIKNHNILANRFEGKLNKIDIKNLDIFKELNLPEDYTDKISSLIYDLGQLDSLLDEQNIEKPEIYTKYNLLELKKKLDEKEEYNNGLSLNNEMLKKMKIGDYKNNVHPEVIDIYEVISLYNSIEEIKTDWAKLIVKFSKIKTYVGYKLQEISPEVMFLLKSDFEVLSKLFNKETSDSDDITLEEFVNLNNKSDLINHIIGEYKGIYDFVESYEINSNDKQSEISNLDLTKGLKEFISNIENPEDFLKINQDLVKTKDDIYFITSKLLNLTNNENDFGRIFDITYRIYVINNSPEEPNYINIISISNELILKYPKLKPFIECFFTKTFLGGIKKLIEENNFQNQEILEKFIKVLESNTDIYKKNGFLNYISSVPDFFDIVKYYRLLKNTKSKIIKDFFKEIKPVFSFDKFDFDSSYEKAKIKGVDFKIKVLNGKYIKVNIDIRKKLNMGPTKGIGILLVYSGNKIDIHFIDTDSKKDMSLVFEELKGGNYSDKDLTEAFRSSKYNYLNYEKDIFDIQKYLSNLQLNLPEEKLKINNLQSIFGVLNKDKSEITEEDKQKLWYLKNASTNRSLNSEVGRKPMIIKKIDEVLDKIHD